MVARVSVYAKRGYDWPSEAVRVESEAAAARIASLTTTVCGKLWLEAVCCAAWAEAAESVDVGKGWRTAAAGIYRAGRLG